MPRYQVSYRGEFGVTVKAEDENDAIKVAEASSNWGFITGEGHLDLFEVEKE